MPVVRFECTCGDFDVEVMPDWAPLGVQRFLELVEQDFFSEVRFFRVVKQPRPFVAQFGISGTPSVADEWRSKTIKDDPAKESNRKGTLTFATSGPNSRTSQLFLNLADNAFLDTQGFPPIGRVVEGMDTVNAICGDYGEQPNQMRIQSSGNAYLQAEFPKLDYIRRAFVLSSETA